MKLRNIEEKFGFSGPFEAPDRGSLIVGMEPTFREWAQQALLDALDRARHGEEPPPESEEKFLADFLENVRREFFAALEEMK